MQYYENFFHKLVYEVIECSMFTHELHNDHVNIDR